MKSDQIHGPRDRLQHSNCFTMLDFLQYLSLFFSNSLYLAPSQSAYDKVANCIFPSPFSQAIIKTLLLITSDHPIHMCCILLHIFPFSSHTYSLYVSTIFFHLLKSIRIKLELSLNIQYITTQNMSARSQRTFHVPFGRVMLFKVEFKDRHFVNVLELFLITGSQKI